MHPANWSAGTVREETPACGLNERGLSASSSSCLYESALPRLGEKHGSNRDAVRAVEPVDGTSIFALGRGRGAPVKSETAAARRWLRQKMDEISGSFYRF